MLCGPFPYLWCTPPCPFCQWAGSGESLGRRGGWEAARGQGLHVLPWEQAREHRPRELPWNKTSRARGAEPCVCWPCEQTQTQVVPRPCCLCPGSSHPGVSSVSQPRKIKISVGECCCLQHTNYTVLPPAAQWPTASSRDSSGPTGTNGLPAHVLKKEPVVADPSASDPKTLKLQWRRDPQVISLVLTAPNSSCCVSCSFENTVARMTRALGTGRTIFGTGQAEGACVGVNESTIGFWFCVYVWWVDVLVCVYFQESLDGSDIPCSF